MRATLLVITLLLSATAATDAPASEPDAAQIRAAILALFEAARSDDIGKFRQVTAPTFYSFDGGKRFGGEELMQHIGKLHAEGWIYEWNVGEPEITVRGDVAWATWLNEGSARAPDGKLESLAWLESAVLQKDDGRWRIHFFHSSRSKISP